MEGARSWVELGRCQELGYGRGPCMVEAEEGLA